MTNGQVQRVMRLSAARAKVRSGYASGFEVCLAGFAAGVLLFAVSAGIYLSMSALSSDFKGPRSFAQQARTIAGFFRLRYPDGGSASEGMTNLALVFCVFGVLGVMGGLILKYRVRKERSDSFFRKKLRFPLDTVPFLGFFAYAGLPQGTLVVVYLVTALAIGYLWRFWYSVLLSMVSSVNVDRFLPRPV